jgi:hypothetical protein
MENFSCFLVLDTGTEARKRRGCPRDRVRRLPNYTDEYGARSWLWRTDAITGECLGIPAPLYPQPV